jgi:uroporphyrinogen decarboxylase
MTGTSAGWARGSRPTPAPPSQPFIPDLIALGVDVLDPLQPVTPDMALERLKTKFGDRLWFRAGIGMRKLLPFGTPEQVQAEARRCC